MPKQGRKSVNIQMASSAKDLKEDLSALASRRAVSVSKYVSQVYTFAVSNQGMFPNELSKPRPKPGKHISSEVPGQVAADLASWAKSLDRSRAHHCCFLLECVVADEKLRQQVFV